MVSNFRNYKIILIIYITSSYILDIVEYFTHFFNNQFFGIYGTLGLFLLLAIIIIERLKAPSITIRPGEKFEGFAAITEIIGNAETHLKIIDPYPGLNTLLAINTAPRGIKIRFLTTPYISDRDELEKVKIQAKMLMAEKPLLEIRSDVSKRNPKPSIHDRFILTRPHGWKIGCSIRDIGNKLTSIDPMSINETEEIEKTFDELWEKSHSFV